MTTLYSRLAAVGIKKNGRSYIPYILTSSVMIMIFYIVAYLSGNEFLSQMRGGNGMSIILAVGTVVMAVFSAIFLFYTNSTLVKRRKKEFGLYNILGLGKMQIARVLIWETLLVYAISIAAGLGLGILFSKLAEMLAARMLGENLVYTFSVDVSAIIGALIWFAIVFAAILLNSLRQLFFSRPVELLHSESTGEKPPRTNVPIAVIGFVLLGIAYYMAVTIDDPMAAIFTFMLAVILVIIATYLLFIAGSVVICRILQKNKNYYYKTKHFVSISQMAYRMRRNGAGLASICILSTMVLVTISSTTALWIGTNDFAKTVVPRDIEVNVQTWGKGEFNEYYEEIQKTVNAAGKETENEFIYHYIDINCRWLHEGMGLEFNDEDYEYMGGKFFAIGEHQETADAGLGLGEHDIAVYEPHTDILKSRKTVSIGDLGEFNVIPIEKELEYVNPSIYGDRITVFVKDLNVLQEIFTYQRDGLELGQCLNVNYYFDVDGTEDEKLRIEDMINGYDCMGKISEATETGCYARSRISYTKDSLGIYSGLFFLGVLLGGVFVLAAALIMYYKQISEGFEDASRFAILRKVGMSRREIKGAINSQVLTVFFLPLIAAGIHMAFAFPILSRLLRMLSGYYNTKLFMAVVLACFAAFAVMYVLFYKLTSRSYLSIVGGNQK